MLTKDLLRVSRAGGGYQPRFAGEGDRELAARVLRTYRGHVGETRGTLDEALTSVERDADDHKLVRGFAKLLDRVTTTETRAAVDPRRARETAFRAAEAVGVCDDAERADALERAAERLDATPDAVATALYADRETRQVVTEVADRWTPAGLVAQYNLSLAQTALFDATALRVQSSDPRGLVAAVKRLGLLHEIHQTEEGRVVHLTGPDALFRRTRRYGTRFARLLRSVAAAEEWRVEATVDDRGTEREMVLTDADPVRVPDADPVTEVSYDSGVERDFAARFTALGLDWDLTREPEPLAAGDRVMIPDFAFDYRHADFRVFFEIMGFWTPEYVEKKLAQLDALDGVEMLVAVDESLGVGEELAARDARAIPYSGTVRVKDVRDALRRYESDLVAAGAAGLPAELRPEDDVVTLSAVAERHGVSEAAVEDKTFPDHERVGRTLVRPAVLDAVAEDVDAGMDFADAEAALADYGLSDASAVLSRLGYRVDWDGLAGGTLRRTGE
ncbi:MAG: DUF790 family protein [Halobacteriaceae archaeon]